MSYRLNIEMMATLFAVLSVFGWVLIDNRSGAQVLNQTPSQTLTERLIAEDPVQLAQEARSNGNIVRGAILFHQGNINCVKCHRPTAEADRLGPDLSRLGADVTDAYLIESILQPSEVIKTGFESTLIQTIEGQLYTGIVLSQDDQQLVIRDSQNLDQPVVLAREEIEAMRPSTISSMPDKLADELKDRQQFLDLLRYVIDIKERGPELDVAEGPTRQRELDPELKGLVLIQQMNCVACHRNESHAETYSESHSETHSEKFPTIVKAKRAPHLEWSAGRLNPLWIEQFIRDPHAVKPGTTMPDLLNSQDADRTEMARAITHFLVSQADNQFQNQAIDPSAVTRGFDLFSSVGCVACHAPRNQQAIEQPLVGSQPLGELGSKYNISGLVEFLENPLAVRPSGHMPNMKLTYREATDIANFLLQSNADAGADAGADADAGTDQPLDWQLDWELAKQGKRLFTENNCHNCHTDFLQEATQSRARLELSQLSPDQGCLSTAAGNWPVFSLTTEERKEIQAALQQLSVEQIPWKLTGQQQVDVSLQAFNCLACHDRNQLGGVTPDRNPHFQTTNLNLGDQGRIPPTLTGVGAKLNQKWMREVLVTGRTIRPYMKTRMPQYGEENIGHLVELFQSLDQLPETQFAEFEDQTEMRKQGLELAGTKGLNCVSCHTYQYKLSDTMPAVDLTEMAERLKKDWFYQYMLSPQSLSPNTVMPSFWPGGKGVRPDIAGTPADQIEAIWQYLIDGRQAAMPHGVVREPLEIVVENEAQILRRSYPGMGKRGIGVGYPGGINLVFDAEQLRLHAIWKGKFVDPGGVWTGQGSGKVRPLGQAIEFDQGPELDDRQQPWIVDEGRPPHHQFQGYQLDLIGRPTFHYRFGAVEVQDHFVEVIGDDANSTGLRRTLLFSSDQGQPELVVRFRIASADKISINDDSLFAIGNQLKIRLISSQKPQIVGDVGSGQQLEIHFDIPPEQEQPLILEYLWE